MSAWYNEFDPKKAAWLRELIAHGVIAPGDVDERSIADVRADDLRGYRQCHFFAGIGIWSYSLRLAGWPDDREVWTGSCPCQPFSAAGKGAAFEDERHLWPEFFRLIKERRPVVCFGEQVASIDGLAWLDLVQSDLDGADYTCGAVDLCAAGVGAPHRRQRIYWVADAARVGYDEGRSGEAVGRAVEPQRLRDASRMAHASGAGLEKRGGESGHAGQECETAERASGIGGVENSVRAERWPDQREPGGHREASGRNQSADRARERSEAERVDNSAGARHDGTITWAEGDSRDAARLRVSSERGPVNGFWRDANWVLTRPQRVGDRPGLRPVEPNTFPLAHGAPARVGRLRGYGDGIIAPLAQAFIEAYLETTK